jgi:hypothetical protein
MDTTKLFHIIGLISALALGVGFVTGVISVWLSWRITQEQKVEIEGLRKENLATEDRLGKEQDKRLELEASLAPRQIPYIKAGDTENIGPLRPFAGMQVILRFLPDAEASRAASNVAGLLSAAGWKIVSVEPSPEVNEGYFDGVVIEPYSAAKSPNLPKMPELTFTEEQQADQQRERRAKDAVEAVVDFLQSNNWQARFAWSHRGELPPDTVRVTVGFKPNPYFDPQLVKESRERTKKSDAERKQWKEEEKQREADFQKRLQATPSP